MLATIMLGQNAYIVMSIGELLHRLLTRLASSIRYRTSRVQKRASDEKSNPHQAPISPHDFPFFFPLERYGAKPTVSKAKTISTP